MQAVQQFCPITNSQGGHTHEHARMAMLNQSEHVVQLECKTASKIDYCQRKFGGGLAGKRLMTHAHLLREPRAQEGNNI